MEGDNVNNFIEIDPDRNHFDNDHLNCSIYSLESFTNTMHFDSKSLNIYHNNTRSIMGLGKLEQYTAIFCPLRNSI